jgi:hypothetical protein
MPTPTHLTVGDNQSSEIHPPNVFKTQLR